MKMHLSTIRQNDEILECMRYATIKEKVLCFYASYVYIVLASNTFSLYFYALYVYIVFALYTFSLYFHAYTYILFLLYMHFHCIFMHIRIYCFRFIYIFIVFFYSLFVSGCQTSPADGHTQLVTSTSKPQHPALIPNLHPTYETT